MCRSRLGKAGATLYFPLSGLTPLPEVDLGQIKLTDRLGPCFHFWYFLVDSPRGHQKKDTVEQPFWTRFQEGCSLFGYADLSDVLLQGLLVQPHNLEALRSKVIQIGSLVL